MGQFCVMFSVVIPLYNKKKWIERCINSVRAQTVEDWEIIVIDDGSTDGSGDIVEAISLVDSRVKYFRQANSGVSVARNQGVAKARSSYVALLDADDYWGECFLQEMSELVDRFPQAKLFAAGFYFMSGSDRRASWVPNVSGVVCYFDQYLIGRPFLSSSSCVVAKDAYIEVGGFTAGVKYHEDLEFWIKVCSKFPVVCSNQHLCHYDLQVEGQASKVIRNFRTLELPQDVLYTIEHSLYGQPKLEWFSKWLIVASLRQLQDREKSVQGLRLKAIREVFGRRSYGIVANNRLEFLVCSVPERIYQIKVLFCYYLKSLVSS
jgi:hypothetical protein